jgi:hypothetical protein
VRMATATKQRIQVSMSRGVASALESISRRDRVPRATSAARLLEIALDLEEDLFFGKLAASRDTKDATFISHEDVWKQYMN